jgi:hypothetical protein
MARRAVNRGAFVSYLRTFAPWIVYAIISGDSAASKQWGALAALAMTVLVVGQQLRRGQTFDALIIEIGSGVFFVALVVLAFAAPASGLLGYSTALSNAALGVIAWGSLAIRRPFTLGIAKQSTPREIWGRPAFLRVNVIITLVWAVSFTLGALVLAAVVHAGGGIAVNVIAQVAALAIPMVFTVRYAAIVRAVVPNSRQGSSRGRRCRRDGARGRSGGERGPDRGFGAGGWRRNG